MSFTNNPSNFIDYLGLLYFCRQAKCPTCFDRELTTILCFYEEYKEKIFFGSLDDGSPWSNQRTRYATWISPTIWGTARRNPLFGRRIYCLVPASWLSSPKILRKLQIMIWIRSTTGINTLKWSKTTSKKARANGSKKGINGNRKVDCLDCWIICNNQVLLNDFTSP